MSWPTLPNFILKQYHEHPYQILAVRIPTKAQGGLHYFQISQPILALNATESTMFNFLQGQFDDLTQQSIDQAIEELYSLEEYNGS